MATGTGNNREYKTRRRAVASVGSWCSCRASLGFWQWDSGGSDAMPAIRLAQLQRIRPRGSSPPRPQNNRHSQNRFLVAPPNLHHHTTFKSKDLNNLQLPSLRTQFLLLYQVKMGFQHYITLKKARVKGTIDYLKAYNILYFKSQVF